MGYSQQVKEDAKAAAEYMREHGWCQGTLQNEQGQCCANGAMDKAIPSVTRFIDVQNAFYRELGIKSVTDWNDKPGRTQEEVLAVFDRIANS